MAKRKNKTTKSNDSKYLEKLEKSRQKAIKQTEYNAKWGWLEDVVLFGLLTIMISYVVWAVI